MASAQFEVVKFLGEGGFGKVFLIEDKSDPSIQVSFIINMYFRFYLAINIRHGIMFVEVDRVEYGSRTRNESKKVEGSVRHVSAVPFLSDMARP